MVSSIWYSWPSILRIAIVIVVLSVVSMSLVVHMSSPIPACFKPVRRKRLISVPGRRTSRRARDHPLEEVWQVTTLVERALCLLLQRLPFSAFRRLWPGSETTFALPWLRFLLWSISLQHAARAAVCKEIDHRRNLDQG